jgi:hypothetical protein
MKHIIKDIEWNGSLVPLDDQDLINEWEAWNERYQKCKTTEVFEEGRPIYDKIRKKYGINTLIQVGHIKGTRTVAMTITDIPVGDTAYHSTTCGWTKNYIKDKIKRFRSEEYEKIKLRLSSRD